ncbi:hypothetical protein P8452_59778 [Trifolium repens]|nr:hypothetical protein P8452_59778 [Trifolium repens]
MASHIYQSHLCLILCFAFILLSGFATSFTYDPRINCSGDCINVQTCNQNCVAKGFKNGYCLATRPDFNLCCCRK